MIEGQAKIVLTRRWPADVEQQMAQLGDLIRNETDAPMSGDQLSAALHEADIVCPTVTDSLSAEILAKRPVRARLLANFGAGFNHIDLNAAHQQGIAVTNTPDVLTDATAEIALTLMMMSARRASEGERQVRAQAWSGWRPTHMLSTQVSGRTLGIIGMGRIGLAFARMAHHGLGMRILYHNRNRIAESFELELQAQKVPLEHLLRSSDFVSVHCPSTTETHHLLDREHLALMPSHAHLINTARGDVVDESALLEALQAKSIAGAGLDVYEAEPTLTPGLIDLEQVVLLPHMGSGTTQTRRAMGMRALANVQAYLRGSPLPDQVTLR